MKKFTVYFEIYGKKLKTTIPANNEIEAMEIVKSSINVVKVRKEQLFKLKPDKSDLLNGLDNLYQEFQEFLDLFGKKK